MQIKPFKIEVKQEILDDLKMRLLHTRWPDEIFGAEWNYGSNLVYMKELAQYWEKQFDWRIQEEKLNKFPQFHTEIDGFRVHFVYKRSKVRNSIPLIITHGWPSSFAEMIKLIPLLTESFDIIIPSLPGVCFSDRPTVSGYNVQKIAEIWMKLMTKVLGYHRFCAHGGDWGTSITARLGFAYPQHIIGIHTTSITGGTPSQPYSGTRPLSKAEDIYLANRAEWIKKNGAYANLASKEPQTYGYGLNDSPIGLAALLVEKFRDWSDCGGDIESRFTKDELLTNITLYWITETITSSMRIYYEHSKSPWILKENEFIKVPCAVACFHKEMSSPVREWAERFYNIRRWTEFLSGGHFPALEEPELLANDIKAFFSEL